MTKPIKPATSDATTTHTADTRNPDWNKYVPEGHGRTDEQIRADIHQALSSESELDTGSLTIEVQDGLVTLNGQLGEGSASSTVIERIRAVPSVRDVRDQTGAR
jgi:osmotically-inducible protein OsmY